jgi:hypothetical protein
VARPAWEWRALHGMRSLQQPLKGTSNSLERNATHTARIKVRDCNELSLVRADADSCPSQLRNSMGSHASRKRTALTLSDSDGEFVFTDLAASASKATSSNAVRASGSSSSSLVPSFFASTRKSSQTSTANAPKAAKQAQLITQGSRATASTGLDSVKKSKPSVAGNGKTVCWYHEHWQPVDKDKYRGHMSQDAALRSRLAADSPLMVCKHSEEFTRRYNPCTKFIKHLLSCEEFKLSQDYQEFGCQKTVAAVESLQVRL